MRSSVKIIFVPLFFVGLILSLKSNDRAPASEGSHPSSIPSSGGANETRFATEYQFDRKIESKFVKLNYTGHFLLETLQKSKTRELVQLSFHLKTPQDSHELVSRRPYLIETDFNGHLVSFKFSKTQTDEDAEELNLVKDFLSVYAYRESKDTTGEYRAVFTEKSGILIEKSKKEYLGAMAKTIQVVASSHKIQFDSDSQDILKIEGSDELNLNNHLDDLKSSYVLTRVKMIYGESLPPAVSLLSEDWVSGDLALAPVQRSLHSKSYAELVPLLKDVSELTRTLRLSLFHDLVKSLKSDPEKISAFKQDVEIGNNVKTVMNFAVGVLAAVGNERAQNLLTTWYASGDEPVLQHTILNSLANADAALTEHTRKFLLGVIDQKDSNPDLAENAAFALGSGLKHGSDSEAREKLLSLFQGARSPEEQISVVDAMGNSGDAFFVPVLMQALTSQNRVLREKAAYASRFMSVDSAQLLARKALADQEPSVRSSAIKALTLQSDLKPFYAMISECASHGDASCAQILKQ